MALDPALESAIKQAVAEGKQSSAVAERMIAWIEALGDGDVSPEQKDAFYARLMGAVAGEEDSDAN
jgi:hypothetical protein